MQEITPKELEAMKKEGKPFQLIDVREPYEVELCNIGGTPIPMGDVVERIDEVRKDVPVVIHCRSGARSGAVINALSSRYGYTNLINLKGGILAYGREVDPSMKCE
ncbi:MAG: rhodanese-like domain-containing protein [Flavobacteriales bacterium]|nr:MAG: rhodanese-like domain-containing protein [Flavobacteriales bacterium]